MKRTTLGVSKSGLRSSPAGVVNTQLIQLVVVVLLLIGLVVWVRNRWFQPGKVTTDSILHEIQDVAKLVTVEGYSRDVVVYNKNNILNGRLYIAVFTGHFEAFVDLKKAKVAVDDVRRLIAVSLPPAQLAAPEQADWHPVYLKTTIIVPWSKHDEDIIRDSVKARFLLDADSLHMLPRADSNARAAIAGLLAPTGYAVSFRTEKQ